MIVRGLDLDHDWLFGKGKNDFLRDGPAVNQNIQTRLLSFVGDCFFDMGAGVDWWNLLGAKNLAALDLSVKTVILNTEFVTGLVSSNVSLDQQRLADLDYKVTTVFRGFVGGTRGKLLTELGEILTTEDSIPFEI